jgi:hypothetical protein
MTWTLHIPLDLPSANAHVVNGRDRATGARYAALRNKAAGMLKVAATAAGLPIVRATAVLDANGLRLDVVRAVPFRTVRLVRLMAGRQRPWDPHDNLPAAFKLFADAMQAERVHTGKGRVRRLVPGAGIVMDDSPRWAAWSYGQERSHDGKPGVLVTVTEVSPC